MLFRDFDGKIEWFPTILVGSTIAFAAVFLLSGVYCMVWGDHDVRSEVITEIDGCKIYKVSAAQTFYWSHCPGTVQWKERKGKTAINRESITK